ncbi:hypothetical protein J7T55_013305 [Diaporthe amygdali]|uniref:uncharacterized protein n=1 Tax=Phomopsis amygdali TaxID=1214568 RepID=UPI0022FE39A7|nr:uncharacterized protein J7T55_013305 [Diaporthe amygdali]KAJ0119070.1 hypothetical protein J7T55_013305 [Diaporthe amygdali]
MSRPSYNRGSSSVDDWLDSQYEYIAPDKDLNNPYVPRDAARDITPERSDASPTRSKGSRSSRNHKSPKDRYRPETPPEEDDLDKERDKHRHTGKSSRSHDGDRDSRRSHQDKDTKYPPRSDRGRPRRPPMSSRAASHYVPRKEDSPERRSHRRYSLSSSPPRHRGDKSSRHYHRHHEDRSPSPPPRSSRKKDDRDRDSRKHHGSSSGSTKGSKSRRPSLSHSQTSKDTKKPSASSRSYSFWNDPRFRTAAEAALSAGATAAVGLAGEKGRWGSDKGGKVLRAGLGAAALSAFKSPAPAPEPAPAAAAPVEPKASAADAAGRYVADHIPGKKSSTRRRHH